MGRRRARQLRDQPACRGVCQADLLQHAGGPADRPVRHLQPAVLDPACQSLPRCPGTAEDDRLRPTRAAYRQLRAASQRSARASTGATSTKRRRGCAGRPADDLRPPHAGARAPFHELLERPVADDRWHPWRDHRRLELRRVVLVRQVGPHAGRRGLHQRAEHRQRDQCRQHHDVPWQPARLRADRRVRRLRHDHPGYGGVRQCHGSRTTAVRPARDQRCGDRRALSAAVGGFADRGELRCGLSFGVGRDEA